MKWIRKILISLCLLPFLLIAALVIFELFGMCVNHIATARQTNQLKKVLAKEIGDIEIIDIYSVTGNTSGTGNHVDCMSVATFSTAKQQTEIENILSEYYELNEWTCFVTRSENGDFTFCLITSAPFRDNIEGH